MDEEVDIDLTDPEVEKAALKIQAQFKGLKANKKKNSSSKVSKSTLSMFLLRIDWLYLILKHFSSPKANKSLLIINEITTYQPSTFKQIQQDCAIAFGESMNALTILFMLHVLDSSDQLTCLPIVMNN